MLNTISMSTGVGEKINYGPSELSSDYHIFAYHVSCDMTAIPYKYVRHIILCLCACARPFVLYVAVEICRYK